MDLVRTRSRRGRALIRKGLLAAVLVGVAGVGMGVKGFRAPTTAVVDIHEVFEGYEKKKNLENTLKGEMDTVQRRLAELQAQFERLNLELKQLEPGSESYIEKMREKGELELSTLRIQQTEVKDLSERFNRILRELRDEISKEIEAFAKAHEIDLVLDRQLIVRPTSKGAEEIRWPIVHFASPDLDITSEVTARLNSRYADRPSR